MTKLDLISGDRRFSVTVESLIQEADSWDRWLDVEFYLSNRDNRDLYSLIGLDPETVFCWEEDGLSYKMSTMCASHHVGDFSRIWLKLYQVAANHICFAGVGR